MSPKTSASDPIVIELPLEMQEAPLAADTREFSATEMFEISRALEPHHAVFYQLWELGRPRFTTVIPTAAVAFNPKGECIDFVINPDFWEKKTPVQKKFIVAHECLHVLLSHGIRAKDAKNPEACNIAMDIVVNELLVSSFGFLRSEVDPATKVKHPLTGEMIDLPKGSLVWRDKIKFDPQYGKVDADQTFEYYYNRFEKMSASELGEMGDLADDHSNFKGDGSGSMGKMAGKGKPSNKPGKNAPRLPKDAAEALVKGLSNEEKAELAKKLGKHAAPANKSGKDGEGAEGGDEGGSLAGDHAGDLIKTMADPAKIAKKKKWETVIQKWSKRFLKNDFKTLDSWIRINRRLIAIPDAALLPSEMEDTELPDKTKIDVFLFLDTSGSCAHLADRFWVAGNSLPPKRFNVRLFCFDTKVYDVNMKEKKLYGFGGTSFDIIEGAIQADLAKQKAAGKANPKYPAAVFIITDGEGNSVKPAKPENWFWFLTQGGTKRYIDTAKSKVFDLAKFE
jgi:predicted metal-dependent peptidase